VKFVQIPDVRSRFEQQGVELHGSPAPEQFTGYIKTEFMRMITAELNQAAFFLRKGMQ